MPKGAASECGGMGRTREQNPSRQAKAAKTGVLRRYIFYEMQADQGVKAIQFVKLRVLVVITNICNSNTIGKACAAPPRRRTIAFGSPRRSARRASARRCPIYSFAAASAVICALPQLGASAPSPQRRGR